MSWLSNFRVSVGSLSRRRQQTQIPRFSDCTTPASFSFAMWCEMVGCVRPRPAVKSQMHIGAAAFHREATMVRRVGSASAFNSAALISAQSPLTRGSSQHTPRSRMTGSSLTATTRMLQYPSTILDGFGRGKPMSEIKEAVRSRYANIARQLEVLPADSTAGCCQLDGPDCGCG